MPSWFDPLRRLLAWWNAVADSAAQAAFLAGSTGPDCAFREINGPDNTYHSLSGPDNSFPEINGG